MLIRNSFVVKIVPRKAGFTLTEVMLTLAVMAVVLPVLFGLVAAGNFTGLRAERKTRAIYSAEVVFEEIRRALNGNGSVIMSDDLPWGQAVVSSDGTGFTNPGDGGGEDGWLILRLDSDGRILGVADMRYEEGLRETPQPGERPVAGIAAIRGSSFQLENAEFVEGEPMSLANIEVRIEYPAQAAVGNRQSEVFFKGRTF